MGIMQTRHNELATQIDNLGFSARHRGHRSIRTHDNEPPVPDRNSLDPWRVLIDRVDSPVGKDQISRG